MMKTENISKFAAYAPISSETYAKKKGATPSKFSGRHKRYRITYRISVPITNRYRIGIALSMTTLLEAAFATCYCTAVELAFVAPLAQWSYRGANR